MLEQCSSFVAFHSTTRVGSYIEFNLGTEPRSHRMARNDSGIATPGAIPVSFFAPLENFSSNHNGFLIAQRFTL